MTRNAKASRREVVLAGAIIGIVGIGYIANSIYAEQQYRRKQDEILAQIVTLAPGKTGSVETRDGSFELTVLRSIRYDSFAEAATSEDLGITTEWAETGQGTYTADGYAVCEIEMTNIDAAFNNFFIEDALSLYGYINLLVPNQSTIINESLRCDASLLIENEWSPFVVAFPPGETIALTLGFPLPEGVDVGGIKLAIVGSYTQFALDLA